MNDYYSSDWCEKFSHVDDAAALVTEGCYMTKTDLQAAYRSVRISDHSKQGSNGSLVERHTPLFR